MKNFDLSELSGLSGFDMIKMVEMAGEYAPKIRAMIPKLQEFLPKIKEWEKKHDLKEGEIILYNAMTTNSNIFIYVSRAKKNEAKEIVLIEQLHRYDLMEMVNKMMTYLPA